MQKVSVQQVYNRIQEAGSIASNRIAAEIEESLVAALNASSGPNASTLTNVTRPRLMQPFDGGAPREMAAAGPAWVQGNDLQFRFCVNAARSFDVAGANTARQEGRDSLIRAIGFRYNADILAADLELLRRAMVTITIPNNTNYPALQVPLNDLLLPSTVQLGMAFDPANATGRDIPGPAKISTTKPLWTPPEALWVRTDNAALLVISDLPGAPSSAAAGTVQLTPAFVRDDYLTGN